MLSQIDAQGLYGYAEFSADALRGIGQFLLLVAHDGKGISLLRQLTGEFESHPGAGSGDEGCFL